MAAKTSGVTLDTIVINIESDASSAVNGVEALAASLVKLKESMNKGFGNLKKLSMYLNDLKIATEGLDKVANSLSSVSQITSSLSMLSQIDDPKGLKNAIKSLKELPGVFDNISPSTLQNVTIVSNALTQSLTPLAGVMGLVAQGYGAMDDLAKKYGLTLTKIKDKTKQNEKETNKFATALKRLPSAINDMNKSAGRFGKDSVNVFKKVGSQIKQIGLSLLGTRTIFTATRKAISEYMQMDKELTDTTTNLWRALGAQLAPAIEYVLFLFEHIVRVIYSVVYALTGIDLIARANAKALATMGKSAKDALGSLQKFDDLNVVEFDKGAGDIPQIELDKIDLTPIQEVIDWMRKLKAEIENAWKTGEWGGVFNVLYEGLLGIIDAVPWYDIGAKIREAIEKIDWKKVWDGIVKIAEESFKGLGEFINGLFGQDEDSSFGTDLLTTFLLIYGTIQLIKGVTGLGGVLETLGLISKAPSFAAISTLFGGILVVVLSIKEGLSSWGEFFEKPSWTTFWPAFFDTLLMIAGVIAGIALLFGAWPVALVAALAMVVILIGKFLYENLEQINDWAYNVGVEIGDFFKGIEKDTKTAAGLFTKIWSGSFDELTEDEKKMGNKILATLESMLNKMISGLNWFVRQINKIQFDVPDWVPVIGGQKWGFNIDQMSSVSLPRLETGTNEVPYEGIYHLHQGEAVVPKKYNPALGGGTNEETNQKLDTLISLMNNMNFTNVVNIGNKTIYKEQQRYTKKQNDIYGTTVNL